ncbi:MAG: hypothetical protein ACO1OB_16145 [Archangium sp.]
MGDETKRAVESMVVGIVVAVLHLAILSGRFATPQGSEGITLMLGCVFTTGILWWMLALRTLANGGSVAPEIPDGWLSMSATAWVFAIVPPRAENFFDVPTVDDFAWVYVPVCLLSVFAMLGAQKLFPARTQKSVWKRLAFGIGCSLVCTAAAVFFVAKGDGAGALAVRSLAFGAVALVASKVLPA